MQVKILSVWMFLLLSAALLGVEANTNGQPTSSRGGGVRLGGCNFRIVRDIMRRACAYHTLEEHHGVQSLAAFDDALEMNGLHEHHSGGRVKKEIELLYIRRVLKECCPDGGCPPLSKFCT